MKMTLITLVVLLLLPGCWGFNASGKQEANLRKDEMSGVYTFNNQTKGGNITALASAQADTLRMRGMADLERARGEVAIKKSVMAQKEIGVWKNYCLYTGIGAVAMLILLSWVAHKRGILDNQYKEVLRIGRFDQG